MTEFKWATSPRASEPEAVEGDPRIEFLTRVAAAVRIEGAYVTVSQERSNPGTSSTVRTADVIRASAITPEDTAVASAALAWAQSRTAGSDFELKLRTVAGKTGQVADRDKGVLAYAVEGLRRDQAKAATKAAAVARATEAVATGRIGHVGTVGTREQFSDVTVARVHGFTGSFGWTEVIRFESAAGDLVWFTGSDHGLAEGDVVTITATVKSHDTDRYSGAPTTKVTRVVVNSNPAGDARVAAEREAARVANEAREAELIALQAERQARYDALSDDFWQDEYRAAASTHTTMDYFDEHSRNMTRLHTARVQLERRGLSPVVERQS